PHLAPPHKDRLPQPAERGPVDGRAPPARHPPGDYMMPRPSSRQEMRSPQFAEKFKRGPVVMFTVYPGGSMAMGPQLVQWFLYSVVVGCFAAYVAGRALPAGAAYPQVFRFVGVTAFVAYAVALWQMS